MFKLTVVGGPARGQTYQVKSGENSIGRVLDNDIVLSSQKVSKKHCVLVVNNSDVTLKDAGSSNGTFVNGVLTKLRKLLPGDRVSVGEFVLELTKVEAAKLLPLPATGGLVGNVIPLPGARRSAPALGGGVGLAAPAPRSLKEKAQFYFEQYVINFVYNLNEKHEWRSIMGGMFVLLSAASAVLAVYPVLDRMREKLEHEASGRAFVLARQIIERNGVYLFEKMDSKVDVSFVEKEPGVLGAYLIDMEGRILAPGRRLNQYLNEPNDAAFSVKARDVFRNKESQERVMQAYGEMIGVAVPLKIFSAASGKNVTVAIGLVFFDRSLILFDVGTEMLAYIQALILIGIVAVLVFFSLYRLTLRPLLALNEDIDQVLKGNAAVVTKKFKMEELVPLIDIVNAALQRASHGGGSAIGADSNSLDEVIDMLKFAADRMVGAGMMIFSADKRILHLSPFMEEITGIRSDGAIGQDVGTAARDSAFVAFVEDILSKTPTVGMPPTTEDFEFSGTTYRMECLAYGQPGAIKAFALTATKNE